MMCGRTVKPDKRWGLCDRRVVARAQEKSVRRRWIALGGRPVNFTVRRLEYSSALEVRA
jgi:hypothetical protein